MHFHTKKKCGIDRNSAAVKVDGSRLFHIHLVGPFSSSTVDEIHVLLPLASSPKERTGEIERSSEGVGQKQGLRESD